MWAPGADLLHLALGQLDGIVCNDAAYEDVGAGLLIATEAGATILGQDGERLRPRDIAPGSSITFVAAQTPSLARQLFAHV